MAELPCMPLKKYTTGPIFGQPQGTLTALHNMYLTPDGYAEARGGFEKPKLVGGTPADGLTSGGYADAIELSTSYGWIRTFDSAAGAGSRYSANRQLHPGGWRPFPTTVLTDAVYFGSDIPFSRIGMFLTRALASATFTVVYEYSTGPGTWSAFAATPETINFATSFTMQFASWRMPTDWVAAVVGDGAGSTNGNVYKCWMRIRITAVTVLTVIPLVQYAFGFWNGMKEIYFSASDPLVGNSLGSFERHGIEGTTTEWFPIASHTAMNAVPMRLAAYRGRVVGTNSKETKRWDGNTYVDLGVTSTAITGSATPAALAAGMGAGIWSYYYAWGNGPCQNFDTYVDRQDAQPLYGWGRASFIASATTTAGVNEQVDLVLITPPPVGVSAVAIYRTDDLTNVPAGKRANMPAYLINSFRILEHNTSPLGFEQAWGGLGNIYSDTQVDQIFPRQEAAQYDVSPPLRCKYVLAHQNWLLLGDDETWFISDPFQIDRFSTKATTGYVRLNGANGGRNMGGVSFGDQAVLFTDNQVWGLTNLDMDVYQLYPIALNVGCIAPDAAAAGEGRLIWPGHDGFYQWLGGRDAPKKISADLDDTFQNLSYETHGGSRGIIVDRQYKVALTTPSPGTNPPVYVFDFATETWSKLVQGGINSTLSPLCTVHAPLGNNDAGVKHGLWGKISYATGGGNDYSLYLGDLTTQDDGANYTCTTTMHFPLPPSAMFKPKRALAYYSAANGWGSPSLINATASPIGTTPGTLNTGTADTGTDYSLIGGTFSAATTGTSDVKVTFAVDSAAGGTPRTQRFYGAIVEGQPAGVRRGAV
jgi:hypothetical protein